MVAQKVLAVPLLVFALSLHHVAEAKAPTPIQKSSVIQQEQGTSIETAVIIHSDDTRKGIHAENEWLQKYYPNYQKIGQQLVQNKNGIYDKITIVSSNGIQKEIYFEISQFFGKINGELF